MKVKGLNIIIQVIKKNITVKTLNIKKMLMKKLFILNSKNICLFLKFKRYLFIFKY